MRKKHYFISILIICTVCGILYCVSRPSGPFYQGKSLHHWLNAAAVAAFPQRWKKTPEQQKANEAVKALGTNAIPTLLKMIRAHDSPLKRRWIRLVMKQRLVKLPITSAGGLNSQGDQGFKILGKDGKFAVPALIQIFEENISPSSQDSAVTALGWIGGASKAAIPCLLRAATDTNDNIRLNAIYGLRLISLEPDKVVPAFTAALKDPNTLVRGNAEDGLENFGSNARSAVPVLLGYLSDDDPEIRSSATNVLKVIDPEAASKAGIK